MENMHKELVYGEIGFGDYMVAGYKLIFKKVNGKHLLYRRIGDGDVIVEKIVYGFEKIMFIPMYPVLTPKYITNYVLVEFETPIHIAPTDTTSSYIELPVDIAVYVYRDRVFTIIDVIPYTYPKYTLYGDPFNGHIARYYRTPIYHSTTTGSEESIYHTITSRLGRALVRILFRNRTGEWVTVSRVLLDMSPLKIFYKPGTIEAYTQELLMIIDSPSTASIGYGDPFVADAIPVDDPPELRQPRIMLKTDMLWGI